jgi:hypothetical protein
VPLVRPIPWNWTVGDAAGQTVLQGLSNGLTFAQNPPIGVYQQTAAQSLATSAFTAVTWPTPALDTYGGYAGANPTRYTPQEPGYYAAVGQIGWVPNATGARVAALVKNGAASGAGFGMSSVAGAGGSFNSVVQAIGADFFNGTTDYFEVQSNQNAGSALNSVPSFTRLVVYFIHA